MSLGGAFARAQAACRLHRLQVFTTTVAAVVFMVVNMDDGVGRPTALLREGAAGARDNQPDDPRMAFFVFGHVSSLSLLLGYRI